MDETKVREMIDAAIAEAGKKTDAAIALHVKDAMKPVTEQLTQLADAVTKPPAKGDEKTQAKPLTAEDVTKIATDAVTKVLDTFKSEQTESAKQAEATAKTKQVLQKYIAEKMKDVPAAYQAQMPATDDPEELAKAEKTVRETMKTELGKAGVKTPDVGASKDAGAQPPAAGGQSDADKSGSKLIQEAYAEAAAGS